MTTNNSEIAAINKPSAWQEFWLKEDWWAVWLGLGIVILAYVFYLAGSSISWIAVAPAKWSTLSQLATQFSTNAIRYLALLVVFLILFTIVISFIGQKPRALFHLLFLSLYFPPSFTSLATGIRPVAIIWNRRWWHSFSDLIISNVFGLPRWLDAGFRVEFYIKLGIVLLGATLPFTLIIWAGPVAILQASIVSIVTFLVIFFTARKLGLDHTAGGGIGSGWRCLWCFSVHCRCRRRRAKKEASADCHKPGCILGHHSHFRIATGFTYASPADWSRWRLDWDIRIC